MSHNIKQYKSQQPQYFFSLIEVLRETTPSWDSNGLKRFIEFRLLIRFSVDIFLPKPAMDPNGNEGYLDRYRRIIVSIVYTTLVLDNVLLTVVGKTRGLIFY